MASQNSTKATSPSHPQPAGARTVSRNVTASSRQQPSTTKPPNVAATAARLVTTRNNGGKDNMSTAEIADSTSSASSSSNRIKIQRSQSTRDQPYRLSSSPSDKIRGRSDTVPESRLRASSAAAAAAAAARNASVPRHAVESGSTAKAKESTAKVSSRSPSSRDQVISQALARSTSPVSLSSVSVDGRSLRHESPTSSVYSIRSTSSPELASDSPEASTVPQKAKILHDPRPAVNNRPESITVEAAAKRAIESQRIALEKKRQEGPAAGNSAPIVAAAKTVRRAGKAVESTVPSVLQSSYPELLSPRPQRAVKPMVLKDAPVPGYFDASEMRGRTGGGNAVGASASLAVARSESCPPSADGVVIRPASAASMADASNEHSERSRPNSVAVSSHPRQMRRLSQTSRIFQPFHSYNRLNVGNAKKGLPLSQTVRAGSVYANPRASASTQSLPPRAPSDEPVLKPKPVRALANEISVSRTPEFSPMRTPMRSTMRKPESVKHLFNSEKPWKHLIVSGSISEAERKRYGALWAANRGTLLPPDQYDCIHGLVVKKIWERSRLSPEVLEKIWNLVSREKEAYLTEDEFLVGTWIVDQCLYGRKLPLQLPPEVWSGVSRLGVSLRKTKQAHKHLHHHHHYHHRH